MDLKKLPDDASRNSLWFLGTLRKRRLEEAEVVSEHQGSVQTRIPLETVFKGLIGPLASAQASVATSVNYIVAFPLKGVSLEYFPLIGQNPGLL